ncbi:MAG TPA: OmpH family outer membrane protein [Cyclobacteriaceae bacterium]|nr:OmpH family outer membrane protein [Cyclobacteriaceae bacterium]
MRKLIVLMVFGLAANAFTAGAQTTSAKIGFADVGYIFSEMPEEKQIQTELQGVQNALKKQMDTKVTEFRTKLDDYQQNMNTMLPAVRANTERELQQLQENLQQLQEDAQVTINQKQVQLMEPVYKKMSDAIEAVAKENGFSMILSGQVQQLDVVLYGEERLDVSDLVLKKLGVTPKPKTDSTSQK